MHKRATLQQLNLSGKRERRNFLGFISEFPEALFFSLRHLCVFVLKKISLTLCPVVILRDFCVKNAYALRLILWRDSQEY